MQLLAAVGDVEHESLDFKRRFQKDDERHVAAMLEEDELRGVRQRLNDLVDQGLAEARGRTAVRRYYIEA